MGFLDRMGKIGSGFYGILEAPVLLVADLGKASFVDEDEFDGFIHTLWGRTVARGTEMMQSMFGPEGGLGSTIGAIPKDVRQPVGSVVTPVMDGLNWVYNEGVSQPLSTAFTVASMADSQSYKGRNNWGVFFDPDAWSKAYGIAEHRSPGQAAALAFGTRDILDPKEVNKFQGTDAYGMASGIMDALFRWYADPVRAGGIVLREANIARQGHFAIEADVARLARRQAIRSDEVLGSLGRKGELELMSGDPNRVRALLEPLKGKHPDVAERWMGVQDLASRYGAATRRRHILEYMASDRWADVKLRLQAINEKYGLDLDARTAAVREEFFPKHPNGMQISSLLARAEDDLTRDYAMRALTGDFRVLEKVKEAQPALGNQLESLLEQKSSIKTALETREYSRSQAWRKGKQLKGLEAQVDEVVNELAQNERLNYVFSTLDRELRMPGKFEQAGFKMRRSEFYQHSPWAKPVRKFFDMRPHNIVDVTDPKVDVQVDRMLREAGVDDVTRASYRGQIVAAPPEARRALILEAEEKAVATLGKKYGFSRPEIDEVMAGAKQYRKASENIVAGSRYDAKGRARILFEEEDEIVDYPLMVSQLDNMIPLVDMRRVERAMKPWRRMLAEHDATKYVEVAPTIINATMKVWRPATLLRPAWPIRVIGDEAMRMAASLNALAAGSTQLRAVMKDYTSWKTAGKNYLAKASREVPLTWGGSTGAIFGGVVAGPFGAVVGGAGGAFAQRYLRGIDEIPYAEMLVNGYNVQSAFGNPGDAANHFKELNSARASMDIAMGREVTGLNELFKTNPYLWTTLSPGHLNHPQALERALRQLQNDPLARVIMAHKVQPGYGDFRFDELGTPMRSAAHEPGGRLLGERAEDIGLSADYLADELSIRRALESGDTRLLTPWAREFLHDIGGASPVEGPFFRGVPAMEVPKVGNEVEMGLGFFARDMGVTTDYTYGISFSPGEHRVIYQVDEAMPAVRGLDWSEHFNWPDQMDRDLHEYLTAGRFKVTKVTKGRHADIPGEDVYFVKLSRIKGPVDDLVFKLGVRPERIVPEFQNANEAAQWWLDSSYQGLKHQKTLPLRKDPQEWVDSLEGLVDDLTLGDSEVMAKLLRNEKVSYEDILAATGPRARIVAPVEPHPGMLYMFDQAGDMGWFGQYARMLTGNENARQWFEHTTPEFMAQYEDIVRNYVHYAWQQRPSQSYVVAEPFQTHAFTDLDLENLKVGDRFTSADVGYTDLSDLTTNGAVVFKLDGARTVDFGPNAKFTFGDFEIKRITKKTQPVGEVLAPEFDDMGAMRVDAAGQPVMRRVNQERDIEYTVVEAKFYEGGPMSKTVREEGGVDMMKLPLVHGESVNQVLGKSKIQRFVNTSVDRLYTVLGTMTTDELTRSPFFARVYRMEMERKLSGVPAHVLGDDQVRLMENAAREKALTSVRDLLYDFAERSEFAEMVRNIIPFYPAWQEVLTRWTGLLYDNPEWIANARILLQAPGKMGIEWNDPQTGESYIRFRLPEMAKGLLSHGFLAGALDDQGYVKINKQGLNIASGLPGFGPWVDVALKPFVDAHPELAESLQIVYPFGAPPASYLDAFLPPNVQKLRAVSEQDGRAYRNAYSRILITKLVKMQTGELKPLDLADDNVRAEFLADVKSEASAFSSFRLVAGLISPAALSFDTPFQPLIEEFHKMQDQNPETAVDRFLDAYGEDFFALTQSFSKTNNGIPPTLQGDETAKKYHDLIQDIPELGGLIMGNDGGGSLTQFSAAVYQRQLNTPLAEGSSVMQREMYSPEQLVEESDTRLGWIKFTRMMDTIDAIMDQRGLTSLNSKGARDLKIIKDFKIATLAQQHPDWFTDYSTRDELKWDRRIDGMRKIVADERLSSRPDIEALSRYLEARDGIMAILAQRESHGITSQVNSDLRMLWDIVVSNLKNGPSGLAFSSLYNRWLENDPLTREAPVGFTAA